MAQAVPKHLPGGTMARSFLKNSSSSIAVEPRILPVMLEDVPQAWPGVLPFLAEMTEQTSGRYTPETARQAVDSRSWMLWIIVRGSDLLGCSLTEVTRYPTGLMEFCVNWLAGVDAADWLHLTPDLEKVARELGCDRMTWQGRHGWRRVHRDYRSLCVFMEKQL
jgi:hypothetical protein